MAERKTVPTSLAHPSSNANPRLPLLLKLALFFLLPLACIAAYLVSTRLGF
jgi:hypothetical protein